MLRRIRALRRDHRALAREGLVIAEGIHLVAEALREGVVLEAVVFSPRLARVPGGPEVLQALRRAPSEPLEASEEAVAALQDPRTPQPLVALARFPPRSLQDTIPGRSGVPLVVLAHGVQDPGNLGSLARAADAAGSTGLVCTGGSANLRHPRFVRATMGSLFRLPATHAEPADTLARLTELAIPLLAADPRRGKPHDEIDWRAPLAVVVGGEGAGIVPPWTNAVRDFVRIPMHPAVESLSVPAAAAVLLFEAARQRRSFTVRTEAFE